MEHKEEGLVGCCGPVGLPRCLGERRRKKEGNEEERSLLLELKEATWRRKKMQTSKGNKERNNKNTLPQMHCPSSSQFATMKRWKPVDQRARPVSAPPSIGRF